MPTPTSLADAEDRRQQITLEIQGIQAQLGDKQRTDESGRRLDTQEYWTWKKRAQHALNQKLDELRTLKAWIKEHRPSSSYDAVMRAPVNNQVDEIINHLENLYALLIRLKAEDVDFDAPELDRIEAARCLLMQLRPAVATRVDDSGL